MNMVAIVVGHFFSCSSTGQNMFVKVFVRNHAKNDHEKTRAGFKKILDLDIAKTRRFK